MRAPALLIAAVLLFACSRESSAPPADAAAPEESGKFTPTEEQAALAQPPAPLDVQTPELNARRGRILFITNGCVICHQVNGVGGKAAPDLSTTAPPTAVNPLEFSARIWRGAPAMTALQAIELGYVINLDAQDLADLAAFVASPEEQKLLTRNSVSQEMQGWFLDEPHWKSGDWAEYIKRGDHMPSMDEDAPN
jgi:mono/diheme cytochrome c family protein